MTRRMFTTKVLDGLLKMIKLSEKYTIKNDPYSWRLITTVPSDHRWAKDGSASKDRWFPTLQMVLVHILNEELKECDGEIAELLEKYNTVLEEIKAMEFKIKGKWQK